MRFDFLREEEFDMAIEKSGGLCVMAVGCIEKHGQHLPVGTDSLKGDVIVQQAADLAEVVAFPTTMWLGDVTGMHSLKDPKSRRLRGYIAMNPHTLLTVLEELCDEIARNGFRKILICSSHGGNTPLLDYFTRSQSYNKRDYATMWTSAYKLGTDLAPKNMLATIKARREDFPMITEADIETLEKFAVTGTGGGHADFGETALVYGTHPDLVAPDRFDAESGMSTHRADHITSADIKFPASWIANYPNAYGGYPPFGCSPTIGQAAVKISVERLVKIFDLLRNDEECVKMAGKEV